MLFTTAGILKLENLVWGDNRIEVDWNDEWAEMASIISTLVKFFIIKERIQKEQVLLHEILNTNLWAEEQLKKFIQSKVERNK